MSDGDRSAGADADRATTDDHEGEADPDDREEHLSHLADIEDGCGCAEVWEHLSERRAAEE